MATLTGDVMVASNGTRVAGTAALQLAELDGPQFRSLVSRMAKQGLGPVEYRARVSAFAEIRRELNAKPKASKAPKAAVKGGKRAAFGAKVHAQAIARGYVSPSAEKWGGAHCYGCTLTG